MSLEPFCVFNNKIQFEISLKIVFSQYFSIINTIKLIGLIIEKILIIIPICTKIIIYNNNFRRSKKGVN